MTEKKMPSEVVINEDAFLDMPFSAQCLYFHLNSHSDSDGIVNNPKKIQKLTGCSDDDFSLLIKKRFVMALDDEVVVIRSCKIWDCIQGHIPQDVDTAPANTNRRKRKGTENVKKKTPATYYAEEKLNQAFLSFLEMRKSIGHPIKTEKAINGLMSRLEKLATMPFSEGMDSDLAIAILEQSIVYEWQDVYALKENGSKRKGSGNRDILNEWTSS